MDRRGCNCIGVAVVLAGGLVVGARGARAQGVSVALSPATQTVAPGGEFDIEVRVTQAGAQFNGFDARVSYDASALTLVPLSPTSLQQGALMTGACGNTFHRFTAGAGADTITDVLLCAGTSLNGPGTLYKLHFRAANTPQTTAVLIVPGSLKFYDAGLYVNPVSSTDAAVGIGMPVTAVGGGKAPASGLALLATPNPSRGGVAFASSWRAAGTESLTVRDVAGRVVRTLALVAHKVAWDGRLDTGERAGSGIYFATLHAEGRSTTIRFSLVR